MRAFLLDTQRGLAAGPEHPDGWPGHRHRGAAQRWAVKIFPHRQRRGPRAERRRKELEEKGQPADFATVLADIQQRDYQIPTGPSPR